MMCLVQTMIAVVLLCGGGGGVCVCDKNRCICELMKIICFLFSPPARRERERREREREGVVGTTS